MAHWTHEDRSRTLDDMTMLNHTTAPIRSHGWFTELRTSLAERRKARAARRQLEAELASYRSPAEIDDLFAALAREEDSAAADDVRRILVAKIGTMHRPAA